MTAFSDLPFEVRRLIWDIILHQSRVVCINMRPLLEKYLDALAFNDDDDEPVYEVLCPTPVPMLLHICSESRALALAHYELIFGNVNCPALRPAGVYHHGFNVKGIPYVTPVESNEAEVAKLSPKVYFNFKHDTVVFGHVLPPSLRGQHAVISNKIRAYYPFEGQQFDLEMLQRLENPATYGHNTHLSRKLELVDLRQNPIADEELQRIAQKFVDRYRELFGNRDTVINAEGTEGVKMICKDGLSSWRYKHLRDLLLRNGTSPEAMLKCVLLRELTTS